jgi:hypothetical protein
MQGQGFFFHYDSSFNPGIYGGLLGWWDASVLGFADNTSIDASSHQWPDLSGNANHLTQSAAGNQPVCKTGAINSLRVVRFDGGVSPNNDKLEFTNPLALSGDFTVIAVGLVNADSIILGNSGANQQLRRYRSSAETMSIFDGSIDVVSSTLGTAHNAVHCMTWRRSGINLKMRENKTDRTSGTPTSGLTYTLNRMGVTSPVFSQLNGDIGEVIVYSQNRTDGEMDSIYDTYLKPKWGLA